MKAITHQVCLFVLSFLFVPMVLAQAGKISGRVTDAAGGGPLPGVNVVIVDTQTGTVTNVDGYYTILNVPPGTYDVRASFVGFTPQVQQDVRVNIDLTSEVDFQLSEQVIEGQEVVVTAQEPVVKRDIAANVANMNAQEIENIAGASDLGDIVGLQAGSQGFNIRGSGADQLNLQLDGLSVRSGRTNEPYTGLSYTSIDQVQVQTGGFNAEYGNVRSGLIKVVTKEGPRDRYTVDVLTRYSGADEKYFGPQPSDPNSFFLRPKLDPDVAFVGTHSKESPWDRYTRRQYPRFDGFNTFSKVLNDDDVPTNDLTPEQAQEVAQWYYRKDFDIQRPDYEVDASLGGPVPVVSSALGGLRFFASYRQTQNTYIIPQERDAYGDRMVRLKLTSDVASGMKLALHGMYAREEGYWRGFGGIQRGGVVRVGSEDQPFTLFADNSRSQADITHSLIGAEFTHTLSARTFYKATLSRNATDYWAGVGRHRETSEVLKTVGPMELTEVPFGWYGPYETFLDFTVGGHPWATRYDTTTAAVWRGTVDLTSQLNRFSQLKAGVEYIANNQDVRYANYNAFITYINQWYRWNQAPVQGAAYVQNKLEFQGLVANVGLRLDYFNPNTDWYAYDPFDVALGAPSGGADALDDNLPKEPAERQFSLSPRLGVSFPVTNVSKIFFNYGHFRQALDPSRMYLVQKDRAGGVVEIGNPAHPMPLTVSYELGYEHGLFDQYLVRVSGYYKALEDQPRGIRFTNIDNSVNYTIAKHYNYEDIRGAEISLQKNSGRWVRGFANYTYMVAKRGNFGFGQQFENRRQQRAYERETLEMLQFRPVPRPYARVSLEVLSPDDFGPEVAGVRPLANWVLSGLWRWRAGDAATWTGGSGNIPGLENNVFWRDYSNLDLRLAKDIVTSAGRVKLFADLSNVLNQRHLFTNSFIGNRDFEFYMESLHLPAETFQEVEEPPYAFIPGDDQPGDFRKPGVDFVPIEVVESLPEKGIQRTQGFYGPLYFDQSSGDYYVWNGSAFEAADGAKVDQVLDDKAYIDMPNLRSLWFLNPRRVTLGLRVTF